MQQKIAEKFFDALYGESKQNQKRIKKRSKNFDSLPSVVADKTRTKPIQKTAEKISDVLSDRAKPKQNRSKTEAKPKQKTVEKISDALSDAVAEPEKT